MNNANDNYEPTINEQNETNNLRYNHNKHSKLATLQDVYKDTVTPVR